MGRCSGCASSPPSPTGRGDAAARRRTHADVTEQRLRVEVNARPAAVVNSAADVIVSLSGEEERILTWNGGAETLFGYRAAEAVGERADMLLAPDEAGAPLTAAPCRGRRSATTRRCAWPGTASASPSPSPSPAR
ncbi:PAS domain S-box protein [Roseomonas sp. GCM10028921]